MNTALPFEIENKSENDVATESYGAQQESATIPNAFHKNSRTPWDPSVLEGIKLKSALSALRSKDKELQALQNQLLNNDLKQ